ncbi:flagellar biosynthesis anti-sigma factor FlgM [Methylosarcina fibrata]|uniref:flagellar biosynthesis anti-sigma factor FlgM n=1 Tax=Methylosarcina fibrata TaxID=105972 RepID=UPI00036D0B03|nr:flagellar biosynthesis anti-sigma factor FlgM [Methylosarcina fibrata]
MTIESIKGRTNPLSPIKPVQKIEVNDQKQVTAQSAKPDHDIAVTTVIQGIKRTVDSSSGAAVDMDRVNAVKKAIADGSYKIDAEQIAKKMIQFEELMPPEDST